MRSQENKITNKTAAIIPIDNPSPIAFINLYDMGDIWVKIQGCEVCSEKNRLICCGDCKVLTSDGKCALQLRNPMNKPLFCVLYPIPPIVCHSYCALEYKCIEGPKKGYIRRVRDIRDEFTKTT